MGHERGGDSRFVGDRALGDPGEATIESDPLLSKIPAVAEGNVAALPDSTPLAAAANPTPLSIEWGLDDYLSLLSGALELELGLADGILGQ